MLRSFWSKSFAFLWKEEQNEFFGVILKTKQSDKNEEQCQILQKKKCGG